MSKGRRFALYFAWSRPIEIGADLGVLDNRYLTLSEFRRIVWPAFERLHDPAQFSQGIDGFLDHVIRADFQAFQRVVQDATGNAVRLIEREGGNPPSAHLDDDLLKDVDTLIVVSLDHFGTKQEATQAEIDLVRAFLSREDAMVVLCPHHDVGAGDGVVAKDQIAAQEVVRRHHGDATVPPEQRLGGFCRSLAHGLGLPIENRFGLNPAAAADGSPAALTIARDLDVDRLLEGVSTFNLHPHLPHLYVPPGAASDLRVLAQQSINPKASPHPFVQAGNRQFNALLQTRPGFFAGRLIVCDATLWSSAFGGITSLRSFWANLALLSR